MIVEVGGYKGYRLVDSDQSGSRHLVSPTGVKVAVFVRYFGRDLPVAHSLVGDDLDCGSGHPTEEHMIRHIVRQYERMQTTHWQRLGWVLRRAFVFLFRTVPGVILTIVTLLAGIVTILTFFGVSF